MEELKNLKNFGEFKDSLNEELLWGAIKNLFNKLFSNMDKKLADQVNNFTKKIDAAKTWDESVRAFEADMASMKTKVETNVNAATGLLGFRKALADLSEALFVELQVLSNKYQVPELTAAKVFAGTPEAEMFNKKNSEEFKTSLVTPLNAKIIELNKTGAAGYDEVALKTYLDAQNNIDATEQATTGGGSPVNASHLYQSPNKLFEATPVPSTPATPATPAEPATPADPATPAAPATGTPPQGDITKLKAPAIKWITENLSGIALKKVKEVQKPKGNAATDPFDQAALNTKATGNTQNLAKLLRNIVQLPTAADLAKVRDNLATLGKNRENPTFKDDIGKF